MVLNNLAEMKLLFIILLYFWLLFFQSLNRVIIKFSTISSALLTSVLSKIKSRGHGGELGGVGLGEEKMTSLFRVDYNPLFAKISTKQSCSKILLSLSLSLSLTLSHTQTIKERLGIKIVCRQNTYSISCRVRG